MFKFEGKLTTHIDREFACKFLVTVVTTTATAATVAVVSTTAATATITATAAATVVAAATTATAVEATATTATAVEAATTATAVEATTTTATTISAASFTWFCFFYCDCTAIQVCSVEGTDGLHCLFVIWHLNKCKSAAAPGFFVENYFCGINLAKLLKKRLQIFAGSLEIQLSNKNVHEK